MSAWRLGAAYNAGTMKDGGKDVRRHRPRLQKFLENSVNERPMAVEGLVMFLLITSGINVIMVVFAPAVMDIDSKFGKYIQYVPYVGLVTLIVVMRGLWDRKHWAWVIALLSNSALLLYGVLIPIVDDWRDTGLVFVTIGAVMVVWGLPVVFLVISRRWYFPPEPEE